MKTVLELLQQALIRSYPIKNLNGGYRDGLRDAMLIVQNLINEENVAEKQTPSNDKDSFPVLTLNPLCMLFTSKGNSMYYEKGVICKIHKTGIVFGEKLYAKYDVE